MAVAKDEPAEAGLKEIKEIFEIFIGSSHYDYNNLTSECQRWFFLLNFILRIKNVFSKPAEQPAAGSISRAASRCKKSADCHVWAIDKKREYSLYYKYIIFFLFFSHFEWCRWVCVCVRVSDGGCDAKKTKTNPAGKSRKTNMKHIFVFVSALRRLRQNSLDNYYWCDLLGEAVVNGETFGQSEVESKEHEQNEQ